MLSFPGVKQADVRNQLSAKGQIIRVEFHKLSSEQISALYVPSAYRYTHGLPKPEFTLL
jgi:hypothetical protein